MPHREAALVLLNSYVPKVQEEIKAKERIKEFIIAYPDCFLRSNLAGHLTASAWILSPDKTKALLTHHKKIGSWIQLGGHADGELDLKAVALKEAHEESGILDLVFLNHDIFDIDVHYIEPYKEVPGHYHYDVRFLLLALHEDFEISDESHALAWVSIDELIHKNTVSETIQRMAKKSLNYQKNRAFI